MNAQELPPLTPKQKFRLNPLAEQEEGARNRLLLAMGLAVMLIAALPVAVVAVLVLCALTLPLFFKRLNASSDIQPGDFVQVVEERINEAGERILLVEAKGRRYEASCEALLKIQDNAELIRRAPGRLELRKLSSPRSSE